MNTPKLQQFVANTWDGDVTWEEVVAAIDEETLEAAETCLFKHSQYVYGIPFDGDSLWVDIAQTPGGIALQKIVDQFE